MCSFMVSLAHTAASLIQSSDNTVIVIDEFDLIRSEELRACFGVLLKQLSYGDVPVRIIFTGIG